MKIKLILFAILILTSIFVSGCIQEAVNGGINISDFRREIDNYVDKTVTVYGKLGFTCPTIYGAVFPRDCIAGICDNEGCVDLHFDDSTAGIRQMLNEYYEDRANISVAGLVIKNECPPNDPACVVTYFIQVSTVKVISS